MVLIVRIRIDACCLGLESRNENNFRHGPAEGKKWEEEVKKAGGEGGS